MSKKKESSMGVTWLGLLAILFIGLKLGGVIDWSWWWVTAPLWAGWVIIAIVIVVVGLLSGLGKKP